MEDASAVDLDWFWRGWFYGTDAVDISIDNLTYYQLDTKNPEIENAFKRKAYEENNYIISRERNKKEGIKFAIEADPELEDFYNKWDRFAVTQSQKETFNKYYASLSADEKKLYDSKTNFYELDFTNKGGLPMPLIIEWTFTDGSKEIDRVPAYIWRKNENKVTKVFAKAKQVASVKLDPYLETADIDVNNNSFPRSLEPTKFELFKQQQTIRGASTGGNPMQEAQKAQK
jgi:hypothetical protein